MKLIIRYLKNYKKMFLLNVVSVLGFALVELDVYKRQPHRYWPQDEDCLSLNIWSQSLDRSAKKPVMFWIHGGAFSMGSSIEQKAYNGENMSRYGDVVVVTVNHRLNILGYLDLSPYGERYAGSANAGQADLVAALKWVRDNIEAFGGDPDNVTIFGQSGGGMKVSGLMQTPEADGLFHRAMIMSGVAGEDVYKRQEERSSSAEAGFFQPEAPDFRKTVPLPARPGRPDQNRIHCLQRASRYLRRL